MLLKAVCFLLGFDAGAIFIGFVIMFMDDMED